MQWIEQLMGISPDGGSGSVEVLLILIPLVALGWAAMFRWRFFKKCPY
jgi:hypothetical protein